jgi:hypothetical protein
MALPKIQAPTYTLKLPSSGKEVKYRPFLVREEKALLFAQQSEDEQVMSDTLKDIIRECTFDKVDIDKLALYDTEYMFLKIRIVSVGADTKLIAKCPSCSVSNDILIDLEKVDVKRFDGHNPKIELFNDVGVMMKPPSYDVILKQRNMNLENPDDVIKLITMQIDYIFDSKNVYKAEEQSEEELSEFVQNMTQGQLNLIKKYFETVPRLSHEHTYNCTNCSTENKLYIEGLSNFF